MKSVTRRKGYFNFNVEVIKIEVIDKKFEGMYWTAIQKMNGKLNHPAAA